MRTLVCTLMSLLLAGVVYATPSGVEIAAAQAATNSATVITTNTSAVKVSGYVQAIIVDLSGHATPTVDVDVVTEGVTMPRITLLSTNNATGDFTVFPSGLVGTMAPIPIPNERIQVWFSGADFGGATRVTGKVDVIIDPNR